MKSIKKNILNVMLFICFLYGLSSPVCVSNAAKTMNSTTTLREMEEEARLGDMELIAQLVEAEAGNQDLMGKRLVVDVILNRVDSEKFPNTVEEVIFQDDQFSVIKNGRFDEAAWHMSEDSFKAVEMEYKNRTNKKILYFNGWRLKWMDDEIFKHQDHWFGW